MRDDRLYQEAYLKIEVKEIQSAASNDHSDTGGAIISNGCGSFEVS
jgi:hypothetical protein